MDKETTRYYTVRQFLSVLYANGKIAPNLLSKSFIVKISKLTKKYCEENKIAYVKTSPIAIRANRSKSVSAYPLTALKETYLSHFETIGLLTN